jgi:DNA polymerase III alpha subunit
MVFDLGKRGSRVIFTMDDRSGRIEASMFEDVWQQYRTLIAKSAILVVEGSLRFDEYIEGWRLTAKRVFDIDHAREQHARRLVLRWPEKADGSFIKTLEADAEAVSGRPLRSRGALPKFCSASRAGALGGMVGQADARAHGEGWRSCAATMAGD